MRGKLFEFLRNKMGGSLLDIEKLNALTQANGLIGILSSIMRNTEVERIVKSKRMQTTAEDFQNLIKSTTEKLFLSLEKRIEYKHQQQVAKAAEKCSMAEVILKKIQGRTGAKERSDNTKLRQMLRERDERIEELECDLRRARLEMDIVSDTNLKLND